MFQEAVDVKFSLGLDLPEHRIQHDVRASPTNARTEETHKVKFLPGETSAKARTISPREKPGTIQNSSPNE